MQTNLHKLKSKNSFIRKCHVCGELNEAETEIKRCCGCKKPFMPTNYFSKVHDANGLNKNEDDDALYDHCSDLNEKDLIKGLTVIW